ncbi:pentapeptide repeat-containing protein [Paenibacillus xanthanilyticus]|uniref:Pentapeptide repeat-containing protein n=1 Tax=Paenibacillus xanthanilyticus TaxID=1783531 RepID=A0ABV8KDM0_9BACL
MEREVTEGEFVQLLRQGQRVFNRICIEEGAYRGFDLTNLTFNACILSVDFSGSNFQDTRFIECNLKSCDFSYCNFTRARMQGNALDGAIFKGAHVKGITFSENTYHSVTITESHLSEMLL